MLQRLRRTALRVFGHLMPRIAASWFEKVMLTPRNRSHHHNDFDPSASGGEYCRIPYGNGWLAVWSWGKGPSVLLLHGWGDELGGMGAFVAPLRSAGFRVIAYDAPAHGTSDGVRTNLIECAGAALQVARTFGPLHGVVAHSFGAPTAALAARFGLTARRFTMLGPPADIADLTMEVASVLGLPRHVAELMARRVAERLRFDWRDFRTDRLVAELNAPLMVVHDRDDRTVPWEHGAAIARAARQAEFVTTSQLGHRGTLADRDVIVRTVAFMRSIEAPTTTRAAPGAAALERT